MGWIEGIRRQFSLPLWKRDIEGEVEEELRFHVDSRVEELLKRGYAEERAREKALREFGDVDAAHAELTEIDRDRARKARRSEILSDLRQDVRFALRALRKRPGFTAAVVVMFALGIGATTAITGVADAALLRPLPFTNPDRLMVILGVAGPDRDVRLASYPEIRDWDEMTRSFTDISIYNQTIFNLSGGGEAESLQGEIVSAGYFRLLGISPLLGRGLLPEDNVPGAAPSVVISYGLWQRRFGGARDVVGRIVTIDDRQAEIVGVMPEGFGGFAFDTQIWTTLLPFAPGAEQDRGSRWLTAIGRLSPGVSREAAQEELWSVARQLEDRYPDANSDRSADLVSLHSFYLGDTRTLLIVIVGAVAFLLLIACVNVINLQLVRGFGRRGEIALRYALGAGRGRLMRQLVTESGVLALFGGAIGVAVAFLSMDSLLALVPAGVLPPYVDPSIDGRVLLIAAAVIGLTGAAAGIVPALRGTRRGPAEDLRTPDRGSSTGRLGTGVLHRGLVAVEVGLAVALMGAAALMLRSLTQQLEVEPGFEPDDVLVARVNLTGDEYTPEARVRFARQLTDALEARAGVRSAGIGWDAPLRGYYSAAILIAEGRPDDRIRYYRHRVTPGYFETLGIRLIRGRGIQATDDSDAPQVAVVSEAFADKVWPGVDAIGRYVQIGPNPEEDRAVVVGVAEDVRFRDLTTDLMDPGEDPDVYFSYAQFPTGTFDLVVRSATSELTSVDVLRRAVAELDPTVPLASVRTLEDLLAAQTARPRFGSVILVLFAAVALALAGIGLYGIMAFLVAARRREIAIRIALGAEPGRVRRMVVRQGMALVAIGAAGGIAAVLLGGQLFSGLLFGVRPADPASLATVVAVLAATATLAHLIPARRAVATEPQRVLREE